MALLVRGKTTCRLCGRIIEKSDAVVCVPPLTSNELDPLIEFNDEAFHEECFYRHPLRAKAEARYQEMMTRTGPGDRSCIVCGLEILDPDDYLSLGHFTDAPTHPLHRFNFSQLHRSCIPTWSDAGTFRKLLQELSRSGQWKGVALNSLLTILETEAGE